MSAVEQAEALVDYTTEVDTFSSGTHAAIHGMDEVESPQERAVQAIKKLERQQQARISRDPGVAR